MHLRLYWIVLIRCNQNLDKVWWFNPGDGEAGRMEVEQLRREVRMRRMPVSETVKTLLVKYIILIWHRYQWHVYQDYILAHQEEDFLYKGTKIKTSGSKGKGEENPFRVKPDKTRGGCQVN
jgi:hypothetical protein